MLGLTLAAAVMIGITLGLLGGGGSILILPALVYLAGVPAKPAIAMSLFIVATTAAFGVLPHARAGRVRWRTGMLFGVAAMVGAYAGGRLAAFIPSAVLLTVFGVMMAIAAFAMIRGRSAPTGPRREVPVVRLALIGVAVGLITGLVGAGGGFVIVPALTLLAGVPMAAAVGTSLLVIAMQSTAGLFGHLGSVSVNWTLALVITVVAIGGSLVGARLVGRVSQQALRVAFGWFLVAMAALVLLEQAPAGARRFLLGTPGGWAVLVAITAALAAVAVRQWRGRAKPLADREPRGGEAPAREPSGREAPEGKPAGRETANREPIGPGLPGADDDRTVGAGSRRVRAR